MKHRKAFEKFVNLYNSVFFKLDRVPFAESPFFYLKDVCKILGFKDPLKALSNIGLCADPSLLDNNITRLVKKSHRYNTLGRPISNDFEYVIEELDVFRLILISKTKIALEIERELFNNVIPTFINDVPKKELRALFGYLGLFIFDIKKEKKTI